MEDIIDFMDAIRRKISRRLAPLGGKMFDIDFSSLDKKTRVSDEDDLLNFMETARQERLRRIELRAIVVEVRTVGFYSRPLYAPIISGYQIY